MDIVGGHFFRVETHGDGVWFQIALNSMDGVSNGHEIGLRLTRDEAKELIELLTYAIK